MRVLWALLWALLCVSVGLVNLVIGVWRLLSDSSATGVLVGLSSLVLGIMVLSWSLDELRNAWP